jgi:hypothetical protein
MTTAPALYHRLAQRVIAWREASSPCPSFPAIAEILAHQVMPETGSPRFLRPPQLRALETYWYLRLVEGTPRVLELYRRLFPDHQDLAAALGLEGACEDDAAMLGRWMAGDPVPAHEAQFDSLRETLTLAYPSYILALAMGAGKTILIGAIIATEFAMSLEYPDGPFVENALVFAPGKTIVESLRELSTTPYHLLLPPRLYRSFAAALKLTITRDGERDLPVIRGSSFNVVVTNTEKICIRAETISQRSIGALVARQHLGAARAEVANLHLQTIASLPHLAIFSDEAHHTYGRTIGRKLKRVRQTVDYLHEHSPNLICVVNTTGTPYVARQPLRDVVIWYGLAEGITDGILKEVAENILAYHFDDANTQHFVAEVVRDFFRDYATVTLPNGAPARLAIYFPRTADIEELRPSIDAALLSVGQSPAMVLQNTSTSTHDEIDAFNRLTDPASPHRVVLLVNKGTEGWNCPSLFACALARKLKQSNNFVLQAATRCLRQVPGNTAKARIYLSAENCAILERQLQETYGANLAELDHAKRTLPHPHRSEIHRGSTEHRLPMSATAHPVLQRYRQPLRELTLVRPESVASSVITRSALTFDAVNAGAVLHELGRNEEIEVAAAMLDLYTATVHLASIYRLDLWVVHDALKRLYGNQGELPADHLADLAQQIEKQR